MKKLLLIFGITCIIAGSLWLILPTSNKEPEQEPASTFIPSGYSLIIFSKGIYQDYDVVQIMKVFNSPLVDSAHSGDIRAVRTGDTIWVYLDTSYRRGVIRFSHVEYNTGR